MKDPTNELPRDDQACALLRRVLAEAKTTLEPAASPDTMKGPPAKHLPESVKLLKALIREAKLFLDALEPIRKSFRLMVKGLKKFNQASSIPRREKRSYRELAASNRTKILDLGPSIYGILPYIEWDREDAQNFLTTFDELEGNLAEAPDAAVLGRLESKVGAVECFAERVADVYRRLLAKLEERHSKKGSREAGRGQIVETCNAATENDATAPIQKEKTPVKQTADKSRPPVKNLKNWAVATHDGKEWHLYHRGGPSWQQWKNVAPRKGHQADLLTLIAKGGGWIEKTAALKLWKSFKFREHEEYDRAIKLLKPEMSHLARRIREAIGLDKAVHIFEQDKTAWRSTVSIGYAVQEDSERVGGNAVWKIKQREELSAEERVDLIA